jgi:hypothetical protein
MVNLSRWCDRKKIFDFCLAKSRSKRFALPLFTYNIKYLPIVIIICEIINASYQDLILHT